MVVANAGIAGQDNFELPQNLDKDAPPPPNLKTIEVSVYKSPPITNDQRN